MIKLIGLLVASGSSIVALELAHLLASLWTILAGAGAVVRIRHHPPRLVIIYTAILRAIASGTTSFSKQQTVLFIRQWLL